MCSLLTSYVYYQKYVKYQLAIMSLYVSVQLQQRLVQNSSHLINRQTTLVSILLLKLTLVTTFLDKLGGVFVCFGVKRKETWRLWV